MKLFEDTRIPLLSKALDAYSLRHKVIASNIANIGTVGYHSKSVSFEDQLSGAMGSHQVVALTTNSNHIEPSSAGTDLSGPQVVDSSVTAGTGEDATASGVNDVDIDQQMTELAKNQLQFKFASKILSETFQDLEKSIKGQ